MMWKEKNDDTSTILQKQSSNASDDTMNIILAPMEPINDNSALRPTVSIKDSIDEAPKVAEKLEDKRISEEQIQIEESKTMTPEKNNFLNAQITSLSTKEEKDIRETLRQSVMLEFPLQLQKNLNEVWDTMKDEQGIGYQDFYDDVKDQA